MRSECVPYRLTSQLRKTPDLAACSISTPVVGTGMIVIIAAITIPPIISGIAVIVRVIIATIVMSIGVVASCQGSDQYC